MNTRFVAEASSNHASDPARAERFVDVAAQLGCSAVKFQHFRIDRLFAPEALARDPKLGARRAWELPDHFHAALARRAHAAGIEYACTPFDLDALELVLPHVDFLKISSYQLLWLDFLRAAARTGKPIVLATGMATMDEVRAAVDALGEGGCARPTLLHCVSSYPTPGPEAQLACLDTLRDAFGTPVGWSDHTREPAVVRRAAHHFRADMVEFHLDLDREGAEYGFGHCWLPPEVQPVIQGPASPEDTAESSPFDGDGCKGPRPAELEERWWRSDPGDGLRPVREKRAQLRAENAGR